MRAVFGDQMLKRILQSKAFLHGVARLLLAYAKWCRDTIVFEIEATPKARALWESDESFVFAGSHTHVVTVPIFRITQNDMGVIAYESPEVEAIYSAWGIKEDGVVIMPRKSKNAGTSQEIAKRLTMGWRMIVLMDGPKGPWMKFKTGAFAAAFQAGKPVLPFVVCAKNDIVMKSWENMRLPLPYSRQKLFLLDPIEVDESFFKARDHFDEHRDWPQGHPIAAIQDKLRDQFQRALADVGAKVELPKPRTRRKAQQ